MRMLGKVVMIGMFPNFPHEDALVGSQLASPPCTDLLLVSFFEPAPAVIT